MLNVIMLRVVVLAVVAPFYQQSLAKHSLRVSMIVFVCVFAAFLLMGLRRCKCSLRNEN
jgi:hypothetical protein